jgi:hypothetical protein
MERDRFVKPDQARDYGLIDRGISHHERSPIDPGHTGEAGVWSAAPGPPPVGWAAPACA